MSTLTPGMTLYWVPANKRRHPPCDVVVNKVGRGWAELSNGHRINIQTLAADGRGYSAPGYCYASQEIYEAEMARYGLWRQLTSELSRTYTPPKSVDAAAIRAAAKQLGIELKEQP